MKPRHHRLRFRWFVGAPLLFLLLTATVSRPLAGSPQETESPSTAPRSVTDEAGIEERLGSPIETPSSWAPRDLRSTQWLYFTCSNDLGRRDITLFGNGTVRLREGLWESQQVYLHELGPDELTVERQLLASVFDDDAISRGEVPLGGVEGDWIERCSIDLDVPGSRPFRYGFGQFEMPPLEVARLVQIAEDLAEMTRPLDPVERLSPDYEPSPGDTLIDDQGARFVVIGLTSDGKGVEVEAEAMPMRIFHPVDMLPRLFVAFELRRTR